VNISSPNTPGLRRLQERLFLGGLLGSLADCKSELENELGRRVPVLVKLAPDFENDQLETAVDVIVEAGLDGIIATNTTIARSGVENDVRSAETGGLSGAALTDLSAEILVRIVEHLQGALPVIAEAECYRRRPQGCRAPARVSTMEVSSASPSPSLSYSEISRNAAAACRFVG